MADTDSNTCGITINLRDCKTVDGQKCVEIKGPACNATIISPSFGCPGVFEESKDITLYVLADEAFLTLFSKKDPLWSSTWSIEDVINYHLKITPWKSGAPKKLEDKLLYAKGTAASHITCTYLDDLRPRKRTDSEGITTVTPAETRIRNKGGKLIACIRESTRDHYIKEGADKDHPARPYLFQIDLKQEGMNEKITSDVFYDCAWFIAIKNPPTPDEEFSELQDLDSRQFVKEKSPALKPKSLFKVDNGIVDFKQFDDASPIQAYHPFIVSSKPHLNIGQLSDMHISSRQVAFRKSQVRVLEGVSDTPTMGELVNVTLDSFGDMLEQMAHKDDIDAIVITGDLIDHNLNFLPTTEITGPGDLWDKMHHQHHGDEKLYPRYLDSLVVFSLLKSCYDKPKWNKPIFLLTGNHDSYKAIYAISPRVKGLGMEWQKDNEGSGWKRANEGLAADHNLTIYEACLMYGPDYAWYGESANFQQSYGDWFHQIFTPLTDYRFAFKDQSFVALGWGNNEEVFQNMTLRQWAPDISLWRASESVSDTQLELAKAGADPNKQSMVFTHFPFASYNNKLGLTEKGEMNCADNPITKKFDDYSQGSFKKNRVKMHELLSRKEFKYTLSGHSHRAGIYEGDFDNGSACANYTVEGHEIPAAPAAPLALPIKDKCNMIVCGCSGPIGVQNHYGTLNEGLGSYGLDYPSGNHIILGASAQIKRIIPDTSATKVPSAKPRFAVALDYMDIIGREVSIANLGVNFGALVGLKNPGVFVSIVSDAAGTGFTFTMNPKLPKEQFIEQIAIVAYLDTSPNVGKVYPMDKVTEKGKGVLEACLQEGSADDFRAKVIPSAKNPFIPKAFLRVTFNNALAGIPGYKQYNFDTPWIFPIEIVDLLAEKKKRLFITNANVGIPPEIAHQMNLPSGYELIRHRKFGEIPNFSWYNDTFDYQFKGSTKVKGRTKK